MTSGETIGPSGTPLNDISLEQLREATQSLKLTETALNATLDTICQNHPTFYSLILRLNSEHQANNDNNKQLEKHFLCGTLTAYAVLQLGAEAVGAALPVEEVTGDYNTDLELNYQESEALIEKKRASNGMMNSDAVDVADLKFEDISLLPELRRAHPQYYQMCVKFGARWLQRPETIFATIIPDEPIVPQIIRLAMSETSISHPGGELRKIAHELKDDFSAYSYFAEGFVDTVFLMLNREERDSFIKEFGSLFD